jgi:hypothetical protein
MIISAKHARLTYMNGKEVTLVDEDGHLIATLPPLPF